MGKSTLRSLTSPRLLGKPQQRLKPEFVTSQCMRNEKRKELIREKKRMDFFGLSQELMSAQELICQQLIQ